MNYREILIRMIADTTPYNFDSTYSFLEQLRKFDKMLHEELLIIEGLTKEIDDQTKAIEEFKIYVTTYLENLDISTPIKEELDKMLADGSLAEVINQDIFNELNAKVDSNTESLTTIEANLVETDSNVLNNTNNINNLSDTITSISNKSETNRLNIETLNNSVSNLNDTVVATNQDVSDNKALLDTNIENTNTNTNDITNINNELPNKLSYELIHVNDSDVQAPLITIEGKNLSDYKFLLIQFYPYKGGGNAQSSLLLNIENLPEHTNANISSTFNLSGSVHTGCRYMDIRKSSNEIQVHDMHGVSATTDTTIVVKNNSWLIINKIYGIK